MIGILLALQINNWNTARQEANTLDRYLNNIRSDTAPPGRCGGFARRW